MTQDKVTDEMKVAQEQVRVTQPRDDLALTMLAAWLNIRPDQIPAENRAHTCAHTMAAWKRVGEAARLAAEAEAADRIEELERKVERLTTAQAEIEAKDQLLEKMGADDDHHDPAR